jgi:hypothetical protein
MVRQPRRAPSGPPAGDGCRGNHGLQRGARTGSGLQGTDDARMTHGRLDAWTHGGLEHGGLEISWSLRDTASLLRVLHLHRRPGDPWSLAPAAGAMRRSCSLRCGPPVAPCGRQAHYAKCSGPWADSDGCLQGALSAVAALTPEEARKVRVSGAGPMFGFVWARIQRPTRC